MKRERYIWVTLLPMCWLLVCTLTAGWQKIFSANTKVGFLSHASILRSSIENGNVLAPAKSIAQMQQIMINDYVDAVLVMIFMGVVVTILLFGIFASLRAIKNKEPTVMDEGNALYSNNTRSCC